jgi:hypothetical protein
VHRTPTFRSCRKVEIHQSFYLFYLNYPFLICLQPCFFAAALWAGALVHRLLSSKGSSDRRIFSGLCASTIRTFGQGTIQQVGKQRSKHPLHTRTRQPAWPHRYRPRSRGEGRPSTTFLNLSSYTPTTATRSYHHRPSSS